MTQSTAVFVVTLMLLVLSAAATAEPAAAEQASELETLKRRLEQLEARDAERESQIRELEERLEEAESRDATSAPPPTPTPTESSDDGVDEEDEEDADRDADLWSRNLGGNTQLRLMDLGIDILALGGFSTESGDELEDLQGGAHDPFQRGFSLTQMELSFRGAVDPYFRAEAYLVFQLDGEGETTTEVEEAFAVSQSLPFGLDELGFEIEAGTFFTEFGRKNPTHPHTWFFVDQPFINSRMFGADGLRGPGVRIGWLTPLPWYSEVHLGMQNAKGETQVSFYANDEVFDERPIGGRPLVYDDVNSLADFTYLARWANAFDPSDEWSVLLGASALFGPNSTGSSAKTMIFGGDVTAKWSPLRTDRGWPYLRSTTEFMYRDYETDRYAADGIVYPHDTLEDWGLYTELVWGFRRDWSAGIRYEYGDASGHNFDEDGLRVSNDTDPYRDRRHRVSPVLVWDPSEYSRIRLQYNFDDARHLNGNTAHSVWIGLEFSLGAHPAHEY